MLIKIARETRCRTAATGVATGNALEVEDIGRGGSRPRPGAIARCLATEPPSASRHMRVTPPAAAPCCRDATRNPSLTSLRRSTETSRKLQQWTVSRPAFSSVQACSGQSRRGLIAVEQSEIVAHRPALTAPARDLPARRWAGAKKRCFGRTKKLAQVPAHATALYRPPSRSGDAHRNSDRHSPAHPGNHTRYIPPRTPIAMGA